MESVLLILNDVFLFVYTDFGTGMFHGNVLWKSWNNKVKIKI